jgi:D-alanine-D-alanine ligase
MRIAVVHNAITNANTADEQDVLAQADAVSEALQRLGHEPLRMTCELNLAAVRDQLAAQRPDLVFNLVESLMGTGRLLHFFPSLLDAMALPYAGASAEAIFLTSNKIVAKTRLAAAGLPTPAWVGPCSGSRPCCTLPDSHRWPSRWIIKSVWEHASIGLDQSAFLEGIDTPHLNGLLAKRAPQLGGACFAEAFIEGREFNLSILDGPDGPMVLPPAEIVFEGYPANQPRIVDYRAKWDPASYEYHHTPRCFDFVPEDGLLLNQIEALALQCWDLFDLGGYARVDFRVDPDNQPWVLEINANPCLSPDAGFAAAVTQAGLSFDEAVARILGAAITSAASI